MDDPARRRCASTAALVAAAALAACGSPYSVFDPASPQAQALSDTGWFVIALTSVTTLVMGFLILVGGVRRRGSLDEHAPIDERSGKSWILIGGIGVPVVVLVTLFAVTLSGLGGTVAPADREADVTIDVTALQWWWRVEYRGESPSDRFTTANEIHVPVGEEVRVDLRSADVIHSFWVPRLHGKVDAVPGEVNTLVFRADEPGVYRGECAEYCGVQHTNMRFLVVAEPEEEFRRWADRQRRPAAEPEDSLRRLGRTAFTDQGCALCHTIRGTEARGSVGPDLTHVGSRRTLAAGTLPNETAQLHAWIVDAQSLKPGVEMPSMDRFDGRTLRAVAAYLQGLE